MVGQIPIPHLDVFGGNGLVENGILHGVGRQNPQIFCRGIMAGTVQAVGIFKVRPGQAETARLVVHQLREALHSAAAVNGQRHGGIVAGGQHQPVEQLLQGKHLPLFQVHGGTLDAHRFLGNAHSVQDVALLANNQRRHDFGGAGDQAPLRGIFLVKHSPTDGIHRIRPPGGHGIRPHRQKQDGGQQCSRRPGEKSSHFFSPAAIVSRFEGNYAPRTSVAQSFFLESR